jgi:hypothetical protein
MEPPLVKKAVGVRVVGKAVGATVVDWEAVAMEEAVTAAVMAAELRSMVGNLRKREFY